MSKPYQWFVPPAVFSCAILAGCARPPDPVTPTIARVELQTPEAYSDLWEAAAEALRRNYFRLDRQDRTEGVLTTIPETSANWFEVWRPQPKPGYYWWESNIATVQRTATIHFRAASSQPGDYELDVEVQRQRYNLTERQVDNSAAALRLYSSVAPTAEGQKERPSQTLRWIPLGRDQPFEERLLADIMERFSQGNCSQQAVESVSSDVSQ
jgi:hypothetical protein